MPEWNGRWKGGRTYLNRYGQTVWVIEKNIHGDTRSIKLDARNEIDAEAELALFLRDRTTYLTKADAAAKAAEEAVLLNENTLGRFLDHLRETGRTRKYRANLLHYLKQWGEVLWGRDLRTLTLQEAKKHLATMGKPGTKNRIIAIKSFFSFLREELAIISRQQDPTLDLKVPPARRSKNEKGYDMAVVEQHYRAINPWPHHGRMTEVQSVRDVVLLHAKCGLHFTELERLAQGEGKIRVLEDQKEIAATITFTHKNNDEHIQSIDLQTLAAAQRLQARGGVPVESWIRKVLVRAARDIGDAERLRLGQLRHSFITWGRTSGEEVRPTNKGVPLAVMAAVVGHKSQSTTARFYDRTKIPPMIRLPINLFHPDDPPLTNRHLAEGQ